MLERALAIKEKALGPYHTSVAITLPPLALVYRKLGQIDKVRPLYERSYA
ncbi:tetratricopeptide repeat protein, partial [Salmonella enterica]